MGLFSWIAKGIIRAIGRKANTAVKAVGTKIATHATNVGGKIATHTSNLGGKIKKMPDLWKPSVPKDGLLGKYHNYNPN